MSGSLALGAGTRLVATSSGDLLLLHGGADIHDLPAQSAGVSFRVATDAGVPVELHYCPAATHGKVIDACPTDWAAWAVDFLDRALAPAHARGPSLRSTTRS